MIVPAIATILCRSLQGDLLEASAIAVELGL